VIRYIGLVERHRLNLLICKQFFRLSNVLQCLTGTVARNILLTSTNVVVVVVVGVLVFIEFSKY